MVSKSEKLGGGEREPSKPEKLPSEDLAAVIFDILKSEDPLESLQLALIDDKISGEFYEEGALVLSGIADAADFSQRVEILNELKESGRISEETWEVFGVALLNLDAEAGEKPAAPAETEKPPLPEEKPVEIGVEVEKEEAPAGVSYGEVLKEAREMRKLHAQAQEKRPADFDRRLNELRDKINLLSAEDLRSLKEGVGSTILTEAERKKGKKKLNLARNLEFISLILPNGPDQAELLGAVYLMYQAISQKGFKLQRLRHGQGPQSRPMGVLANYKVVFYRYLEWYQKEQANLTKAESRQAYELIKNVAAFLSRILRKGQAEESARISESSRELAEQLEFNELVRIVESIDLEVFAQLASKEKIIAALDADIKEKEEKLSYILAASGEKPFAVAKSIIQEIMSTYGLIDQLKKERVSLEAKSALEVVGGKGEEDYKNKAEKAIALANKALAGQILEREQELLSEQNLPRRERKRLEKELGWLWGKAKTLEIMEQNLSGEGSGESGEFDF